MNPIFISYRRDDGIDTAQLLRMHLINMFGEDAVFLDTNTMRPGEEFPLELHKAVIKSKIVIAMIGKNWKGSDPQINRLNQENDWVRKELEIALADEKKKIFPVLVKGATRVSFFKDLPSSIERLTKFNYAELREKEFKQDLLPLFSLIEPYLKLEDPLKDLPLDEDHYKYPPGSPFKGLDYFTEKDAKLFFGRGTEIRRLYNKIKNRNILFLYGQSGCGKSSLLFAGLKPRMQNQGWKIEYFRRESGINLAKKLNEYVLNAVENVNHLVIIDQVEEIFTNPDTNISSEAEAQQLLSSVRNASEKIRVLLSFRKEYLAEIKKLFTGLTVEEIYLEPLKTMGVLESIRGITKSDEARDNYELEFADDEVSMAITQSVTSDEESHVAPLLQVLLTKMWLKVENKKPRIFSKELLEEVKSHNLISLLNDQIYAVKEKYKSEVENGLVLDILYFFTTARSTSASHSKGAVKSNYSNPNIIKIITELKNKYLLSEPKNEDADINIIRLAHDLLAPLIRELFGQSFLPGQRAAKLLESKRRDIYSDYDVEFSKPDISIIDAGKDGMRKWTEKEKEVIEKSKQRIQQYDLELEEKNKQLEATLKEAKEQTLQAKSKALAATAREILQPDPTMALRLAEAACKITPVATKEAQSAIVDIMRQKLTFYKKSIKLNTEDVNSVAFSPDGKFILTGSGDKIAKLWNLDGILKQSFKGHKDRVNSVAFSPDGKCILTGSSDNTAKLWNLDGTLKQSFEGHKRKVFPVAFSPDGKCILTGGWDKTAKLWNLDGTLKQSFEGHAGDVNSVAFSPDGKCILTGSSDNTAKLWNLYGTPKQSFGDHTDISDLIKFFPPGIHSVAFSPDGKYILTGSGDKKAKLWNLDGTPKQSFEGHTQIVSSVAFSHDGKCILTGSGDKTAKLWNLDGTLKQSFEGHKSIVFSVAFSADRKCILTGSGDNTVKLWNVDGTLKQSFVGHTKIVFSVAFSPDGKCILTGSEDNTAKLWNLDGTLKQSFKGHKDHVSSVAFSADGKCILTGSGDKTAKLWNLDGTLKQSFKGHKDHVNSVAFSPDGKYILTGSGDNKAKLWNLDGTLKQSFDGHKDRVKSVAFSPDGRYILTGGTDKTVKLWNYDGTLIQTFKGHKESVSSVAFSADGKCILTGGWDRTAKLWNLDGTLIQTFKGHNYYVSSVAFSPDGKYILTGSYDTTAKLWNLDGTLKQSFDGHTGFVLSVAFSPDSKCILTGGSVDKTAKLWLYFLEILNPENTCVPTLNQMKEYDIPEDMEWGKPW